MESRSWRFASFTKKSNTAIERYNHKKNDDSPGGKVAKELRHLFISRVTMNLKAGRDTLRNDHLDFLNPDKATVGGERKEVEVINDNMRILYWKSPYPSPFSPRSDLILEVTVDYDIGDGKKATLICGKSTAHPLLPDDPTKEVRMKESLFASFYEELEVGGKPLTRWTSLLAGSGALPRPLKFIDYKMFNKYFDDSVEMFATKYDKDHSDEQIIYTVQE